MNRHDRLSKMIRLWYDRSESGIFCMVFRSCVRGLRVRTWKLEQCAVWTLWCEMSCTGQIDFPFSVSACEGIYSFIGHRQNISRITFCSSNICAQCGFVFSKAQQMMSYTWLFFSGLHSISHPQQNKKKGFSTNVNKQWSAAINYYFIVLPVTCQSRLE